MTDDHIEQLIAAKVALMEVLELQAAQHGSLTPADITVELQQLRAEIANLHYQRSQRILQVEHLDLEPAPSAQGLVLLISPLMVGDPLTSHSAYQAIEYHRATLRHCWMIATAGTKGSLSTAEALARHVGSYAVPVPCTIHTILNGADAAETQAQVATIYEQIEQAGELDPTQVFADITGGSKAMTAGMVLACGTNYPMQYMFYRSSLPSAPVRLHVG